MQSARRAEGQKSSRAGDLFEELKAASLEVIQPLPSLPSVVSLQGLQGTQAWGGRSGMCGMGEGGEQVSNEGQGHVSIPSSA